MSLYDARHRHLKANVCECETAIVTVTSQFGDAVIPMQNLLIPPWLLSRQRHTVFLLPALRCPSLCLFH